MNNNIEYQVTSSLEEAQQPGKWLYTGDISVDTSVEYPYIYSVGGDVWSRGTSSISLPLCTSVGGDVLIYDTSSIYIPKYHTN